MGGSSTVLAGGAGQPGVYGTQSSPAAGNIPGARVFSCTWSDGGGNFWLFGGRGYDANGAEGYLNDLWEFTSSSNEWTWMSGASIGNGTGVYGTYGVPAAGNTPGARAGAACWIDNSGNLWLFGGNNAATGNSFNDLWEFSPSSGEWSWMGGSSQANQPGSYGSLQVPSEADLPGARAYAAHWRDSQGNFWLFGGQGRDAGGTDGYLNDLWRYSPADLEWTWMGGSSTIGSGVGRAGVYGTKGSAAAGNIPGGRISATAWSDAGGRLWLLGGAGVDSSGSYGELGDLWLFDPSSGEWTWMGGNSTRAGSGSSSGAPGSYGSLGVAAAGNFPGARDSALAWVDAAGVLWLFGGSGYDASGQFGDLDDLWSYNSTTNEWTWMAGTELVGTNGGQGGIYGSLGVSSSGAYPGGRHRAAGSADYDGNVYFFGGYGYDADDNSGYLNDLWLWAQPMTSLTVSLSGAGAGSVISTPAGIDCPSGSCTASFPAGTVLTLSETPSAASLFSGWSITSCAVASACSVTLPSSQPVTASFIQASSQPKLTVVVIGSGGGSITSSPAGISCSAGDSGSCQANFLSGSSLTLTATANSGSVFSGWSGGCSGVNGCELSLTANQTVYATLTAIPAAAASLPTISTLSPMAIAACSNCEAGIQLTIDGANFTGSSVVLWNGYPRATNFVSSTQLTATITVADLATAQTALVTVANPAPAAAISAASPFAVRSPVAEIQSVSVLNQADGSGNYAVGLVGTGFLPASTAYAGATELTTEYLSPWQLGASLPSGSTGQPLTVENSGVSSAAFLP
jgi:N-acetylneuraminic acid mutarotase